MRFVDTNRRRRLAFPRAGAGGRKPVRNAIRGRAIYGGAWLESGRVRAGDEAIAKEAFLSPFHFARAFKAATDPFLNDWGLRTIFVIARDLRGQDTHLVLCAPSARVLKKIRGTGLERFLSIHESRAQALASLEPKP